MEDAPRSPDPEASDNSSEADSPVLDLDQVNAPDEAAYTDHSPDASQSKVVEEIKASPFMPPALAQYFVKERPLILPQLSSTLRSAVYEPVLWAAMAVICNGGNPPTADQQQTGKRSSVVTISMMSTSSPPPSTAPSMMPVAKLVIGKTPKYFRRLSKCLRAFNVVFPPARLQKWVLASQHCTPPREHLTQTAWHKLLDDPVNKEFLALASGLVEEETKEENERVALLDTLDFCSGIVSHLLTNAFGQMEALGIVEDSCLLGDMIATSHVPHPRFGPLKPPFLSIKYVTLTHCNLIHIEDLSRCRNIERMYLSYNRIFIFPAEVAALPHLRQLHADCNCIEDIPPELFANKELLQMNFSRNCVEAIPEDIVPSKCGLRDINLSHNKIDRLPLGFLKLKDRLDAIRLDGNVLHERQGTRTRDWAGVPVVTLPYYRQRKLPSLKAVFHLVLATRLFTYLVKKTQFEKRMRLAMAQKANEAVFDGTISGSNEGKPPVIEVSELQDFGAPPEMSPITRKQHEIIDTVASLVEKLDDLYATRWPGASQVPRACRVIPSKEMKVAMIFRQSEDNHFDCQPGQFAATSAVWSAASDQELLTMNAEDVLGRVEPEESFHDMGHSVRINDPNARSRTTDDSRSLRSAKSGRSLQSGSFKRKGSPGGSSPSGSKSIRIRSEKSTLKSERSMLQSKKMRSNMHALKSLRKPKSKGSQSGASLGHSESGGDSSMTASLNAPNPPTMSPLQDDELGSPDGEPTSSVAKSERHATFLAEVEEPLDDTRGSADDGEADAGATPDLEGSAAMEHEFSTAAAAGQSGSPRDESTPSTSSGHHSTSCNDDDAKQQQGSSGCDDDDDDDDERSPSDNAVAQRLEHPEELYYQQIPPSRVSSIRSVKSALATRQQQVATISAKSSVASRDSIATAVFDQDMAEHL